MTSNDYCRLSLVNPILFVSLFIGQEFVDFLFYALREIFSDSERFVVDICRDASDIFSVLLK